MSMLEHNTIHGQMKDNKFISEESMKHNGLSLFVKFKREFFKFALLILVISLTMITGCFWKKSQISYDFSTYLSYNTNFEKKASIVLPSKKEIEDSKVVYYAFYDNSGSSFQEGMLRLTVEYSNEKFINETWRLEEIFKTKNLGMGGRFYYNGNLYDSFQYKAVETDNEYCALAYHICSSSNTISYIVFSCENLTYMSVEDAISSFPQMEDQVIQYNSSEK